MTPALWWLAAGFVILILEMLSGTLFFLWLSGAMFLTGVVSWMLGLSWESQVFVFAVASVAAVLGWRRYRPLKEMEQRGGAVGINNRLASFVGREVLLEEPLIAGRGRVRLDDSYWTAEAEEDMVPGTRVRVTAVDGMTLKVEKAG